MAEQGPKRPLEVSKGWNLVLAARCFPSTTPQTLQHWSEAWDKSPKELSSGGATGPSKKPAVDKLLGFGRWRNIHIFRYCGGDKTLTCDDGNRTCDATTLPDRRPSTVTAPTSLSGLLVGLWQSVAFKKHGMVPDTFELRGSTDDETRAHRQVAVADLRVIVFTLICQSWN